MTEAQKALYRMPVTIIVVVSLILAVAILVAVTFLFRSRREKKAAKAGDAIEWQRQDQQPDAWPLNSSPEAGAHNKAPVGEFRILLNSRLTHGGAPSPFPENSLAKLGRYPSNSSQIHGLLREQAGTGQQPAPSVVGSSGLGQSWGQPAQDDRTITGHEFGRVPARNLASEYLQFTAFHPRVVPTARWSTLLVYAYIESALEAIRADAAKFKDELGPVPVEANVWASQPVTRGTQFTIVPTCQGIIFNPDRAPFTWIEDWHQAKFRFWADKSLAGTTANGEITIYAGPLMIASLKISLRFAEQSTAPTDGDIRNRARSRPISTNGSSHRTAIAIRRLYLPAAMYLKQ